MYPFPTNSARPLAHDALAMCGIMSCQGNEGNKCGSPIQDDLSAGSVDHSQLVRTDSLGNDGVVKQRVQGSTPVSLTPTADLRRFPPPLPSPASQDEFAFRRSGLVTRSPPPGLSSAAAETIETESAVCNQGTPETEFVPVLEASSDEKNEAVARESVDAELKKMRDVILDMRTATLRQRNVSMDVKNGLVSLEASLDKIESIRKAGKACMMRLRESQAASPSVSQLPVAVAAETAGKRQATSPLSTERKEKRQKDANDLPPCPEDGNEFVPALSRGKRRRAKARAKREGQGQPEGPPSHAPAGGTKERAKIHSKPRSQVVLIKPIGGKTYADILGTMRKEVTPEDSGTVVRHIRKTATGGVLLELAKCDNRAKLQEDIQRAVGDQGEVRSIVPKMRIEILDLDSLVTDAEVREAIRRDFPDLKSELKLTLFGPNRREQRKAVIEMDQRDALQILERRKIKVGWVVCRIRQRLEVQRCYRCLGYGHVRKDCSGPDRSGSCWKCGSGDHRAADCNEAPSCVLCSDTPGAAKDHVPGSGACGTFRKVLDAKRAHSTAK